MLFLLFMAVKDRVPRYQYTESFQEPVSQPVTGFFSFQVKTIPPVSRKFDEMSFYLFSYIPEKESFSPTENGKLYTICDFRITVVFVHTDINFLIVPETGDKSYKQFPRKYRS